MLPSNWSCARHGGMCLYSQHSRDWQDARLSLLWCILFLMVFWRTLIKCFNSSGFIFHTWSAMEYSNSLLTTFLLLGILYIYLHWNDEILNAGLCCIWCFQNNKSVIEKERDVFEELIRISRFFFKKALGKSREGVRWRIGLTENTLYACMEFLSNKKIIGEKRLAFL